MTDTGPPLKDGHYDYQELRRFFLQKYGSEKTSLLNLLISPSYAGIGILLISIATATLIIFLGLEVDNRLHAWKAELLKEYIGLLKRAYLKCESDKLAIENDFLHGRRSPGGVISNHTIIFMEKLPEVLEGRFLRPLKTNDYCADPEQKPSLIPDSERRARRLCAAAAQLQQCLDDTKKLMLAKNLTIDNSRRRDHPKENYYKSPYYMLSDTHHSEQQEVRNIILQ